MNKRNIICFKVDDETRRAIIESARRMDLNLSQIIRLGLKRVLTDLGEEKKKEGKSG